MVADSDQPERKRDPSPGEAPTSQHQESDAQPDGRPPGRDVCGGLRSERRRQRRPVADAGQRGHQRRSVGENVEHRGGHHGGQFEPREVAEGVPHVSVTDDAREEYSQDNGHKDDAGQRERRRYEARVSSCLTWRIRVRQLFG